MSSSFKGWFPTVFFATAAIFLALYLVSINYSSLARLTLNWQLLIAATASAILFRYWGVLVWRFILSELGSTSLPTFRELSSVYAKAWMGRYIPGKVTWIAAKVYLATRFGISRSRLAVSSLLEGGMQIVAVLAVSMLLLGLDPRLDVIPRTPKLILVALATVCLVALHPIVFNQLARRTHLIIKGKEPGPELRINCAAAVKSFGLYSVGTIISGTSFYLLARSVDPMISGDLYLYCVGSYTLAGAIGMATPLLPSGVGVRDGVLLVLLTVVLPAEIAVALTILSRLWSAIVDILFYIVATGVPGAVKQSG